MHKTTVILEPSLAGRGVTAASPESDYPMLHPTVSKSMADLPPEKQKCGPNGPSLQPDSYNTLLGAKRDSTDLPQAKLKLDLQLAYCGH